MKAAAAFAATMPRERTEKLGHRIERRAAAHPPDVALVTPHVHRESTVSIIDVPAFAEV